MYGCVVWRRYTVEIKREKKKVKKTILAEIYGTAAPGEMMCIMGTSGAGKTSMLNTLSGGWHIIDACVTHFTWFQLYFTSYTHFE
jgi:ABC-type multidrug transport system ATPase subunit